MNNVLLELLLKRKKENIKQSRYDEGRINTISKREFNG